VSTVEIVTDALRREILEGERVGGQRLVEHELTARFGVARHTLRAALRALAAEGLVRVEPNRGARVARLSAEDVVEERACAQRGWGPINEAHAELHAAIVAAAESPRIEAAHAALSGELRLFLAQLEPLWSVERMAVDHAALVRGLERDGPTVLREHLGESAAELVAAEKRDTGRADRVGGPSAR
jgi:DNA-binding GntR family transcriptional regulator